MPKIVIKDSEVDVNSPITEERNSKVVNTLQEMIESSKKGRSPTK